MTVGLVGATIAVMKNHNQSNLEEEGVMMLLLRPHQSASKEVRQELKPGRNLEAELTQRSWHGSY